MNDIHVMLIPYFSLISSIVIVWLCSDQMFWLWETQILSSLSTSEPRTISRSVTFHALLKAFHAFSASVCKLRRPPRVCPGHAEATRERERAVKRTQTAKRWPLAGGSRGRHSYHRAPPPFPFCAPILGCIVVNQAWHPTAIGHQLTKNKVKYVIVCVWLFLNMVIFFNGKLDTIFFAYSTQNQKIEIASRGVA